MRGGIDPIACVTLAIPPMAAKMFSRSSFRVVTTMFSDFRAKFSQNFNLNFCENVTIYEILFLAKFHTLVKFAKMFS